MTERSSTMTTDSRTDWWAVTQAAQGLGINTRRLVALRNTDEAREWALQMSREQQGVISLSYYELAAMLGHREPEIEAAAGRDWNELLRAAEKLAAAVKVKVQEEAAAAKTAAEGKAEVSDAA
jgi:hypothetical protein